MGTKTKYATSTSNSEPWAEQQPYIKQGMAEAKKKLPKHKFSLIKQLPSKKPLTRKNRFYLRNSKKS